jgi:antitoxin HigA-1
MLGPFPPVHPGEILRDEFLEPLALTPYKLAHGCLLPRSRIERLVRGQTGLTADTAHRLARFFNTSPEFWMNLQSNYDLTMSYMLHKNTFEMVKARAA